MMSWCAKEQKDEETIRRTAKTTACLWPVNERRKTRDEAKVKGREVDRERKED